MFEQYAFESPSVDDWLNRHGADEAVTAKEMRGRFAESTVSNIYRYQFTPDHNGPHRAIVMPVGDVDIVAFRYSPNLKKLDVWGCATGTGRFLNAQAIHGKGRVRVHENWRQWLREPTGVLPLKVCAMSDLRDAGDIVVGDAPHALQLLYEACATEAERAELRPRIWIDDARDAA